MDNGQFAVSVALRFVDDAIVLFSEEKEQAEVGQSPTFPAFSYRQAGLKYTPGILSCLFGHYVVQNSIP